MRARLLHVGTAIWNWLWHHPYFAAAFPVVIAFSIGFCHRTDSEWDYVYVVAANHLRQGVDIYTDGNSYPPFAALIAVPFSYLSPSINRFTWLVVNLACLAVMVRGAWSLAGGSQLQGPRPAPFVEHVAAVLGFLCGVSYLQNSLAHQQTDVVIGALLVVGCLALRRSHSWAAGTCFGLAAALKCTALLWAPYLLWRRRPLAAVAVIIVALGVNLLPNLVSASPSGRLWLDDYVTRFLRPLAAADHVVGTWNSDVMYNQSLAGAAQRWIGGDRTDPINPAVLRAGVVGLEAVLCLLVLAVCRGPFRRLTHDSKCGIPLETAEYSIVLMLMLLLSPMSSKAHFGVLILPGFLLARSALHTGSRLQWASLLLAVTLALLSNKDPLGEDLYTLTLWYGTATWQTLALLVGNLAVIQQSRKAGIEAFDVSVVANSPKRAA
jgi:Glycosyltransferase family 87